MARITNACIQPSFSTIRCKTLDNFIKVCYSLPDVAALTPRRLLASLSDVTPIPRRGRRSPSTFLTSLSYYLVHSSSLSPLDATLMDLPASVANKRLTAKLSPLDATLTKTRGGGILPGTCQLADVSTFRPFPIPFAFRFLRTLWRAAKTQLFSFQAIPHSLPKTTRGGGTCGNQW